jgi:hypothetical protein
MAAETLKSVLLSQMEHATTLAANLPDSARAELRLAAKKLALALESPGETIERLGFQVSRRKAPETATR